MSPERITRALDAVTAIETQATEWHNAVTEAISANNRSLASINMTGRRDEHAEAIASENARHARAVLELQRDHLLKLLDEARDLIDDRPRLAKECA